MYNFAALVIKEQLLREVITKLAKGSIKWEDSENVFKLYYKSTYIPIDYNSISDKEAVTIHRFSRYYSTLSKLVGRDILEEDKDDDYSKQSALYFARETKWKSVKDYNLENNTLRFRIGLESKVINNVRDKYSEQELIFQELYLDGYTIHEYVGSHFILTNTNSCRNYHVTPRSCDCSDFSQKQKCNHVEAISSLLKNRSLLNCLIKYKEV